jgi:hypothetical protein
MYGTKLYYKRSYMFRCLCTIFRELIYCVCLSYKILKWYKIHKAVGRCMVKYVLLIKCDSSCICNLFVI